MTAVRNQHEVPLKQWRKWSRRARHVFNELYSSMKKNAWVFQPPSLEDKVNPRAWRTTAWNAAWMAADACDEIPIGGLEIVDYTKAGKRVRARVMRA